MPAIAPYRCLLLWAWMSLCALEAGAQESAHVEIPEVQLGLGGAWKAGHWTPVQITLESEGGFRGRVEVTAPDSEGTLVTFTDPQTRQVSASQRRRISRLVKIGRLQGELTIRAVDESGRELGRRRVSLSAGRGLGPGRQLTISLGGDAGLNDPSLRRKLRTLLHRSIDAPLDDLPERWEAWQAVDQLVVVTADGHAANLTAAQVGAIEQWVRMGGHLILSAAEQAEPLLAEGSPWRALAPGPLVEVARRNTGDGLEQLAAAQQRLEPFLHSHLRPQGDNQQVLALIDSASGRLPAVIRSPLGFGLVTYLGADLDRAPLSRWPARPDLLVELLRRPSDQGEAELKVRGKVRHVGYDDLSGQIRSALDQFEGPDRDAGGATGATGSGVRMIAFSLVIVLLAVYVLLLGPGDYFLLRRLGRFHGTWVTFPLLVLLFCGLLIWIRGQLKSDQLLLNQLDVVDVDMSGGTLRGTYWGQLYSPSTRAVTLAPQLAPALPAESMDRTSSDALLAWQGLPGTGLGGIEAPTAVGALDLPYAVSQTPAEILGLPMRTASTRSVGGRWWGRHALAESSDLVDRDGVLRGTLTNPLTTDLNDCVLFYGTWAHLFDGGRLRSGETVAIRSLLRREIDWRLTDKRIVKSKTTFTMTPWNTASREVPRIVEMLMFHQAAGGSGYTRLNHQYQGYLDLTSHLKLGRALLVGRAATPAARLEVEDADPAGQRWTFYRIMFPVAPARKALP